MPQLHLYVSEEVAAELGRRAEAEGESLSRYLARIVTRELGEGWPEGWFEEVVGSWEGEPLERPDQATLEERDPM